MTDIHTTNNEITKTRIKDENLNRSYEEIKNGNTNRFISLIFFKKVFMAKKCILHMYIVTHQSYWIPQLAPYSWQISLLSKKKK